MDAADAGFVDLGQQMMQAVPEFVEQRGDLVVRQQRRLAGQRRGEVADQIGHRQLQSRSGDAATAAFVHPGAAAFGLSRVRVKVEQTEAIAIGGLECIDRDAVVPDRLVIDDLDADIVEPLHQIEHAADDLRRREVRTQHFVGQTEAVFLELFGVVGRVPGFERAQSVALFGEGAQRFQLGLRTRSRALGEIEQERFHRVRRFSHLRLQRQLGVVGETQ